jgi:hypothetical protein
MTDVYEDWIKHDLKVRAAIHNLLESVTIN